MVDTSINWRFEISTARSSTTNASTAQVSQNSPLTKIVGCNPGITGGIPQPNIVGLVANLLQGTTGTLSCTVTQNAVTSTQNLNFAVNGGQVTLGGVSFALTDARISDSVLANDVSSGGAAPADSTFAYSAIYSNSAVFSAGRSVTSKSLIVTYGSGGTSYSCLGNRQ
jgi:hypothetical protein